MCPAQRKSFGQQNDVGAIEALREVDRLDGVVYVLAPAARLDADLSNRKEELPHRHYFDMGFMVMGSRNGRCLMCPPDKSFKLARQFGCPRHKASFGPAPGVTRF